MRLIRCHIENFGKLQDFSVDFDQGKSVFCQENGWGKSTLAAFIRVMFFGFEGETKRKGMENERRRYQPWQGGTYGGQVIFETGDKHYRLTRIFADKKQNDIFELRDVDTNLESRDFSENLGEELFRINSESFLRTVFISQNDCVTHSTDSIHAKIGNLTDKMNDLDCYEKAAGILKDELNRLNPRRKTGEIYQRKEEITRMGTEILAGESLESSMDQYEVLMLQDRERLTEQIRQRKELVQIQRQVSLAQDRKAKQAAYGQICEEYAEKKRAWEAARNQFPGEVLEEEEVQACSAACNEMEQAAHSMQLYGLNEDEIRSLEVYENAPSEKWSVQQILEEMEKVSELTERLKEADHRSSILKMKKMTLDTLKTSAQSEKKPEKKNVPVRVILGMVLALVGIPLFRIALPAGIGILVLGVALLVTGVLSQKGKKTLPKDEQADSARQTIHKMEEELRQDEAFIKETYQQAESFLTGRGERFFAAAAAGRFQEILKELAEKEREAAEQKRNYQQLLEKRTHYQMWSQKYHLEHQFILSQWEKMGLIPEEDLKEQVQNVWKNRILLTQTEREFQAIMQKKHDFEAQNDLQEFGVSGEEQLPTLESLSQQMRILDSEIEQKQKQLRIYEGQMQSLQEKYDAWIDKKEQLQEKKEAFVDLRRQYRCMQKAQEYLARARETLTARYMEPLMNRFSYYYQLIMNQTPHRYHMDANTNLTVEEQGVQRETAYLSAGYQDLIGLCLRFALVDVMYQAERPFLILDDPFVNLDDEKLSGARKLLEDVSQRYQVIYFTCTRVRE